MSQILRTTSLWGKVAPRIVGCGQDDRDGSGATTVTLEDPLGADFPDIDASAPRREKP
jgi:hypothetical protein